MRPEVSRALVILCPARVHTHTHARAHTPSRRCKTLPPVCMLLGIRAEPARGNTQLASSFLLSANPSARKAISDAGDINDAIYQGRAPSIRANVITSRCIVIYRVYSREKKTGEGGEACATRRFHQLAVPAVQKFPIKRYVITRRCFSISPQLSRNRLLFIEGRGGGGAGSLVFLELE